MSAVEIYERAVNSLERNKITLGEFEAQIAVLEDVEPMVRCKDCTNWDCREINGKKILGKCRHWGRATRSESFCSYGERKLKNG